MDSTSAFRSSWKVRLVAFGIGILVAAVVFGIALAVSDDLRLLYVSGALLLGLAAFLLGAPARGDLIAAVLLLFASMFLFAFFVLPQTPLLWPALLLWMAIVVWFLFRKRFGRMITIVAAMILSAVSAWYMRALHSGADAARVNARGLCRGAAIHFATNQPEADADSLYTRQNSCARFFRHLVLHVLQSCRNWSEFVPIFRLGATLNSY
jgi:hypothetical protein